MAATARLGPDGWSRFRLTAGPPMEGRVLVRRAEVGEGLSWARAVADRVAATEVWRRHMSHGCPVGICCVGQCGGWSPLKALLRCWVWVEDLVRDLSDT
jgi:hypothetical protein